MKRNKIICTLGLIPLLLSACGALNDSTLPSEPHSVIWEPVSDEEGKETSRPSEAEDSSDEYRSVYKQFINENAENSLVYSLIYLNDDDIPELAVLNREYDNYSIYTVKDNSLFPMVDSKTTTELTYFEGKGIIAGFASWNGGGDEGGYGQSYYRISDTETLTDDATPILDYSYNAIYDDEGTYTGEGTTDYYYLGQETDEASWQEMLSSLGITETNSKLCMENALEKEKMLDFLNQ